MISSSPRVALALAGWLLFAAACSKEGMEDGDADGGSPDDDAGTHEPEGADVGSRVFDTSRVATIALEVTDEGLATLRADADKTFGTNDFTYVPARMTFDGETYEKVGLRVKGNSSRAMAQGDALPFKVDMNRYVAGQRIDGLSKINLHNTVSQPTAMNEYLSYGAFREFGVAASRTAWADLTLNGQALGVYSLVEQVNEKMLDRWFEDGGADLYKPESPAGSLSYLGETIEAYTNVGYEADNETDHATFLRLTKTISEDDVSTWHATIDIASVLTYLAGNVALGNWDTYVAMGHNYYLFEAAPGKMTILPWDMNLSQGSATSICPTELQASFGRGGPGGAGGMVGGMAFDPANPPQPPPGFMPPEGSTGGGLPAFPGGGVGFPGGGGGGVPPAAGAGGFPGAGRGAPLHDGLMGDSGYFTQYRDVLRSFLAGPGSVASLNARIDAAIEVLGTRIDSAAVSTLRDTIAARVGALESALTTTTSCPLASTSSMVP